MRSLMKRLNVALIVWLAAVLASQAQAQEEGIVQDPTTGDFVITYTGDDGVLKQAVFVPPTKIDEQLRSEFEQTSADTIRYSYKVANGAQGEQTIVSLGVKASSVIDGSQATPERWHGVTGKNFEESGFLVGWLQLTSDPAPLALSPGSGPSDFAFASNDLPGVGIMEVRGAAPVMSFEDEGPFGEIGKQYFALKKAHLFVSRHAAVPTIPVPEPFDAAAILSNIQSHLQELVGRELVEPAFASQLDGRFTAAREAFGRDDTASTVSHLKDLQALITEEAGDDNEEWDSQEKASPTLLITQLAARVLLFDIGFVIGHFDTDGDRIPDDQDACPASDTRPTVIIDGCDSGVTNLFPEEGCTISDKITECAQGAKNHGKFVSCVAKLTNALKKAGIITGQQKGAIQSCAAQADIP